MMKKILFVLFVLVFAITCNPTIPEKIIPPEPWDGTTATEPTIENGNTYLIENGRNLYWIAQKSTTDGFNGETIKLTSDIDLNHKPFPVISPNSTIAFSGNFEGSNKMIMNVNIGNATNEYQAFIGYMTNGAIKNLILTNGNVVGKGWVAGIVANISAISKPVILEHCTTYLNVKSESDVVDAYIGGVSARISGFKNNLQIFTSTNYGNIVSKITTQYIKVVFLEEVQ